MFPLYAHSMVPPGYPRRCLAREDKYVVVYVGKLCIRGLTACLFLTVVVRLVRVQGSLLLVKPNCQ